jgi:hypothetical protein
MGAAAAITEATPVSLGLLMVLLTGVLGSLGLLSAVVWQGSEIKSTMKTSLAQNQQEHKEFRESLHSHANKIQMLDGRAIRLETRMEDFE